MGSVIGAIVVWALVVGVLVPGVAWLDRRQRAGVTGGVWPPRDDGGLATAAAGLFVPLAEAVRWLRRPDPLEPGAAPVAARIAPAVSFVAALLLFAVIPFGGRYSIGASPTTLVVADPEWGLLLLLVAPMIAALGLALVGLAGGRVESRLAGIRAAAQGAAGALALGASLLPMWIVYGTLRPTAVGAWQDGVIAVAPLLARLGMALPAWLPAGVGLPAWGIVVNPPAFVLCFVAALVVAGRPPFDAPTGSRGLLVGLAGELSGARRVVFVTAGHLWTLALACALVLVFLGGWSLPWISQAAIVGFVEPWYGEGFANLVCGALHVATFFAKLALVLQATLLVRWSLPRWRDDQAVALCVRRIVPLALLDAVACAVAVVALSGSAT